MSVYIELASRRIFETDEPVALNKGLVKELVDVQAMDGFDENQHARTAVIDTTPTPAQRVFGYRALTNEEWNAGILSQLAVIDSKSIRALRENDADRITQLETQATALRATLRR